jgi:hypothetical protein
MKSAMYVKNMKNVKKWRKFAEMKKYSFKKSRTNRIVPAIIGKNGEEYALHSLDDPQKEAARVISNGKGEGFLIFLGLGGGFLADAALSDTSHNVRQILIVDFDKEGVAELAEGADVSAILNNPLTSLLVDPSEAAIEAFIIERYQPVLMNGLRVIPLRSRVDAEPAAFARAESAVTRALEKVRADYSVQAHFGLRWFSNIVRNIKRIENSGMNRADTYFSAGKKTKPHVVITAAGPSLDECLPVLKERRAREDLFVIAADTSLPALLNAGTPPDAVISIDCQIWSYQHFRFAGSSQMTAPLFLDMASPPLLAERSAEPVFFSGGHPLSRLFAAAASLPELDTSGGTVTCAAISLAEALGAESVELYGADFSYPMGITYARGTWLYPFYDHTQTRLAPAEASFSDLLYRTPLEKRADGADGRWRYGTPTLDRYRDALRGTPHSRINRKPAARPHNDQRGGFLAAYKERLEALSFQKPDAGDPPILATLLPTAAALQSRQPSLTGAALLEAARNWCVSRIERERGADPR